MSERKEGQKVYFIAKAAISVSNIPEIGSLLNCGTLVKETSRNVRLTAGGRTNYYAKNYFRFYDDERSFWLDVTKEAARAAVLLEERKDKALSLVKEAQKLMVKAEAQLRSSQYLEEVGTHLKEL